MPDQSMRDQLIAQNEVTWRAANEEIEEAALRYLNASDADSHLYSFVCECGQPGCTESVQTTLTEYEDVRGKATHFLVKPGHQTPSIEQVIYDNERFAVVEKIGIAGLIAEAEGPRDGA